MKPGNILYAFLITVLLPALLCGGLEYRLRRVGDADTVPAETEPPGQTETTQPAVQDKPVPQIPVILAGDTRTVELEDYIVEVVLGEMPADFHPEALKAQAVVARTYTWKHHTEDQKHPDGALCTDPGCCQAHCGREAFLASGHTQEELNRIEQAVAATAGQVLTYEGKMIDATYFSCSGGYTEAAVAVWGTDVPYLQAVPSPGEEMATHYTDTVTFTAGEFLERLDLRTDLPTERWIGSVTYTDGGGVEDMEIAGVSFSGTKLRSLLDLRSTAFRVTAVGSTVTVTTRGFGHRVGMSQYGAQAMAQSGSGYGEILAYYYPSTVLESMLDN